MAVLGYEHLIALCEVGSAARPRVGDEYGY
jgi:hypothetical protein